MIADASTPTRTLAAEIERLMATAPDSEHDLADVLEMIPGMSPTGARAALLWLVKAGRATEAHGYYSPVTP